MFVAIDRSTMSAALRRARLNGLHVETCIDVGAGSGTEAIQNEFSQSCHVLIEPLREFETSLNQLAAGLERVEIVMTAVGRTNGEIELHVHDDLYGSSLYQEREEAVNGVVRNVPCVTLDSLIADNPSLRPPYLLKIDVQGAELDVLEGAPAILADTSIVITEAVFFDYFVGGPTFETIFQHLSGLGFVVYDVLAPLYRPIDGALSQIDVVFVPRDSSLRRVHRFATQEQRKRVTERLRASGPRRGS